MSDRHSFENDRHAPRPEARLLAEGRNCWRTCRAERVAFLVDAAAYFRAFKVAALMARHSILIAGWDVNSRMSLEFADRADPDVPNELGEFLNYLASRRRGLRVRVLCWESPLLYAPDRELLPQARFDWFTHPRMCFALDNQHPVGASHHQKIVVVDDSIAFVGGIDLTVERLDDSDHLPDDPRRRTPSGRTYAPFHDVQMAVDGAAAGALAEVARDRWTRGTGQRLRAIDGASDCWPAGLSPDLTDVDVSIARTDPAWKGRAEVREVEALFLESIAAARESVYIENQYFSANAIAQAMRDRLAEPDCPEIVLVVPREPTGWLEQTTMGLKQRYLLASLREADQHGRFHVYTPHVGEAGDVPVKVHAKLMVVDGRFLHLGSANLNNRSMGLDTECDAAIEGAPGSATAEAIAGFRDRLIAEHLGVPPACVTEEVARRGSLLETIDGLSGSGRTLTPFPETPPDALDSAVAEAALLDPPGPVEPERLADEFAAETESRSTLRGTVLRVAAVAVALLALAALWRWGPIAEIADASRLEAWGRSLNSSWLATAAVIAAYVIGGLVMFPVVVLIAATGLLYGPLDGLLVAGTGSIFGAVAGYGVGMAIGRNALRRLARGRLDRLSHQLARRGVLSMAIIRLLPIAPFTLINLAAGASHIGFRDFVLGTLIGMAPGIVAMTLFAGQLGQIMRSPDAANIGVLFALLVVIGAAVTWSWRRFGGRRTDATDAG